MKMETPENPYLVEKLKRFNVTDAEGVVLGSAESLVEALEANQWGLCHRPDWLGSADQHSLRTNQEVLSK